MKAAWPESSLEGDRLFAILACALVFLRTVQFANFEQVDPIQVIIAGGALLIMALVFTGVLDAAFTLAFVGVVGIALRLKAVAPISSDVWKATAEALATLQGGANPYLHFYTTTNPPGSPFVYLPGELALYAIQSHLLGGIGYLDRWWGILVLVAIVALAPLCGFGRAAFAAALYSVDLVLVLRSIDGSNDTALAFLVTASVVLLAFKKHDASAVALGWALAFKALSWPFAPFLLLFVAPQRRLRYALIAAGVGIVFCLPFAVLAPQAFFTAIFSLDTVHGNIWGFNLWATLIYAHVANPAQLDWMLRLRYVVPVLAIVLLWRRAPTLGVALLQGAVVLGAALLLAPWSTYSYYVFLSTLVIVALATLNVRAEPAGA